MSTTVLEAEQARRLAAMRAAAPLPLADPRLVALRQPRATPASGAPSDAAAATGPTVMDDTTAPATAAAPATTRRPPIVRPHAPVPGLDVPFSQNPPTELEKQNYDRAIETNRLLAAGIDPWAPLQPPNPAQVWNEFHRGILSRTAMADQPPPAAPSSLLPQLQEAKAARRAARLKAAEAARPLSRAEADIALLQRDIDAARDLPEAINNHYAGEIAAGRPAVLDAHLTSRMEGVEAAQRRLEATRLALGPLQKTAAKAAAEQHKVEAAVETIVLQMVALRGEAIAIEAITLRDRLVELQNDLLNLGAIRLGTAGAPKLSHRVWLACNDELPKPVINGALIREWSDLATDLLADTDEPDADG